MSMSRGVWKGGWTLGTLRVGVVVRTMPCALRVFTLKQLC